jgi:hypothetical protein
MKMAGVKIFQNNRYQSHYVEFVADTPEDVKKLQVSSLAMGSEVYVISEKKTYILDSKKTWHAKADNDNSIIECDCVEELTIWEDLPDPSKD